MPVIYSGTRLLALASVLALTAEPASAATLCSVAGAQLAFGPVGLIAGLDAGSDLDHDSTADLAISCSGDAGATVGLQVQLDGGSSGNPLARQMTGPGTLAYNVFADAGRTQVWGDGAAGTALSANITIGSASATGSAVLTLYGRIPRGQRTAPVGSYTDSVLVTIVY